MVRIDSESPIQWCRIHKRVFRGDQCDLCSIKYSPQEILSQINLLCDQGLSQRQIALSVGKSQQYVSKVLKRSKSEKVHERFHNFRISFKAVVPFDDLDLPVKSLHYTKYKLFDSKEFYCMIFPRSIMIAFHKAYNIYDKKCQVANDLAISKVNLYLDQIPKGIRILDDVIKVVSRHNAFMNDLIAKSVGKSGDDLKVVIDDEVRVVVDHSKGVHELEFVNKDHLLPDSTIYENFLGDLIMHNPDPLSVQNKKINQVVDVLHEFAEQFKVHSAVQQGQLDNMNKMSVQLDRFTNALDKIAVLESKKKVVKKRRSLGMTSPRCHR